EDARELRAGIPGRAGWFSCTAAWRQKLAAFRALIGPLKEKHYDLGFDFRGDLRNILLLWFAGVSYRVGFGRTGGGFLLHEDVPYDAAQHQVLLGLSLLRSFHVAQDNKLLPFEYSQEREREFWDTTGQLLPRTDLPRVVIHAEAGYPSKCWPFEDFRALIQMIDREALAQVVLIGTEGERERGPDLRLSSERFVDLRGKTALRDLPVLFDACDVFVGNDSGPAHIAAAQGLEIVLLASGTNDMRFWYPWTDRLSLLQYEVPCAPCGLEVCPVEGHPCMGSVTVDQAFDALRSVLVRLQERS
nr:glycosyltransferase family 9 protein [Candidatus Omnitrophota bacterium]